MWNYGYWNRKNGRPERPRPEGGIALYGWVWKEQIWSLLALNFMVLLCCLPVVTTFPALTAMNRVIYNMIDDKPQMLWPEFKTVFRREWKRSVLAAIPLVLIAAALVLFGGFFRADFISGWRSLVALIGLWILAVYGAYVFAILGYVDLTIGQALKNAALMLMACIHYNLVASLLLLAVAVVLALLSPLSVPVAVVSVVPLFGYTMAYCTHSGVAGFMVTEQN